MDSKDGNRSVQSSVLTNSPFKTSLQYRTIIENRRSVANFICGGLSGVTNIIVMFPLYKTIFFQQLHGCSWPDAVILVYKERLRNLYRGVMPLLMQKSVSVSIMFGVYAHTDEYLKRHIENLYTARVLSAICAGGVEATLCPFERVQTLLQNRLTEIRFRNTFHAFRGILFEGHGGLRELYRGFTVIIVRNSIGNAAYFVCREEIFKRYPTELLRPSQRLLQDFGTGALLGAFISTILFPLNTIKTQMQSQLGGSHQYMFKTLKRLYYDRQKSIRLIYRGLPANCLRSMLSWGIITMSVNFYKRLLFPSTA